MTKRSISLAGRVIGPDHPPYIIAELSANHNGSLEHAIETMMAAKEAGVEAVKLQTYTPDTMTIDHDGPGFRIEGGLWDGRTLYDLYGEAYTPWDWHKALYDKGRELGLMVFSTPFDETAVDFLEELDNPIYKIASFEVLDLPLIRRVAKTGKPLIISTGMAMLGEIEEAVDAARSCGNEQIVLLHCVSGYPAPAADANLRTITNLADAFDVVTGLSDHTLGVSVPVAAIAQGACLIEKHFTLDRADGGPDAAFSLEPAELNELASGTRTAWEALGTVNYRVKESEQPNLVFRRSLYVVKGVAAGELLTTENVRAIRPGFGLAPKHLPDVIGRCAVTDIPRGTPLDMSLVGPLAGGQQS